MKLLNSKASLADGNLIGCAGGIRAFDRSGTDVYASPITINIAPPPFNASFTWLACVLAHESCHAAVYLAKRPFAGLESRKEATPINRWR
jgi:hypothetical protein